MIDLPQLVAQNIDGFTGRTWLLPKILDWWGQSNERLFLLTGGPGTGKSMIVAWLVGCGPPPREPAAREQLARARALVKATHFCQAASRNTTPQAFAESIVNQLTSTVPGFGDALAATLADRVSIVGTAQAGAAASGSSLTGVVINRIDLGTLGDEVSFDRAFTQPLKRLYANGYTEPILLLVDALDESQTYTGKVTLPSLLSGLADLPAGVRILATTRDDPDLLQFFRGSKPLDLIRDAAPDVDDVRNYAVQRLTKLVTVSDGKRNEFAERLAKQAQGIFLYAAVVLDDLLKRPPSDLPDLGTYRLPNGLSGIYHDFLNRELGEVRQPWSDRYRPLLGLVAVAQGEGLSSPQLASIVKRDLDEVGDTLRRCKQYLDGELPKGPFRPFHKSFADFLLEDEHNVDYHIDAVSMHKRVADHYWAHKGDWSKCDDYGLESLAIHLHHGQQFDRLAELIDPGWMHARVLRSGSQYSGFVADLTLAWQRARKEALQQIAEDDEEFAAFAACFLPVLIRAGINSLSKNYPPALVKRALENGLWSAKRAMDVAAHISVPKGRAALYAVLLEKGKNELSEVQWNEVQRGGLVAVGEIVHEDQRAQALEALAPHLSGTHLQEALAVARGIKDEGHRARVLGALALQFSGEAKTALLVEALAAARMIEDWIHGVRARALETVVPQLSGLQLDEVLTAARRFKDEMDRAQVLVILAPHLSGMQLQEALATAGAMDGYNRAQVLVALAPHLSGGQLEEALALARDIEQKDDRAGALAVLAPRLGDKDKTAVLDEALAAARGIEREGPRARALAALAPQLSGKAHAAVLDEAVAAVQAIEDRLDRLGALEALAPQLRGDAKSSVTDRALAAARDLRLEKWRARGLAALATQLSGEAKSSALDEALAAARAIEDKGERACVLGALAAQMKPEARTAVLDEALAATRAIEDQGEREWAMATIVAAGAEPALTQFEVLGELAPQLSGTQLEKALGAVGTLKYEFFWAMALCTLALRSSREAKTAILDEALAAARAIKSEGYFTHLVMTLVQHLSGDAKTAVLDEALAVARAMESGPDRARVLEALVPQLGDAQLKEAFAVARTVKDEWCRAQVLVALAPRLSDEATKAAVLHESLAAAWVLLELSRGDVVIALASHLSGTQLGEALTVTRLIEDEVLRARVLEALAPKLSGTQLDEALAAARRITDEAMRTRVLEALAPKLSGTQLDEALAAARRITDEAMRARVLAALAPQLSDGEMRISVLDEVLAAFREIKHEADRARVLEAFVPRLSDKAKSSVLDEALAAFRQMKDQEGRAWALSVVAAQLNGKAKTAVLGEALAAVQDIEWESDRARALEALAPQLRGTQLDEAFAAARTIKGEDRALVLKALAPQVTSTQLDEAIAATRAMENPKHRTEVLAALASQLSGNAKIAVLGEALAAVQDIELESHRAEELEALAHHLSGTQLDQALATARAIENERDRAYALGALAPHLSGTQVEEALAAARAIVLLPERLALLGLLVQAAPKTRAREIRQCLVSVMDAALAGGTDYLLLSFVGPASTIVGPGTLAVLARHIVEARQWRWL